MMMNHYYRLCMPPQSLRLGSLTRLITNDQMDGFHRRSMSYLKAMKNLNRYVNQTSIERKKDLPTFQPQKLAYPSGEHKTPNHFHQIKPFSLIEPRNIYLSSKMQAVKPSYERLESGMVLLKNYMSIKDQVEIVNLCQEYGIGPGGFYQPAHANGAKMRLQMMCFGRNWDPQTKYKECYRSDGSEAPPFPDRLVSLVETALQDSRASLKSKDEIPSMYPDICIVNFYATTGRLGLHQDCDESSYSLQRGLPVVSISIGDTAEFVYGYSRDYNETNKVMLKSGDVLIFGGQSRHVFHGVTTVFPNTAPRPLLEESMLKPGRLNLTFRQF